MEADVRIVIFANGLMDDPVRDADTWIRSGDLIVAADGGTHHVLAAQRSPHHIIGDLDSLPDSDRARLESQGVKFEVAPAAKDETDLELALLWAARKAEAEPQIEQIVVLGAFGGRPDQALANLLLLALPPLRDCDVVMVDGAWEVRLLDGGKTLELQGRVGDRLSLIPLGGSAEGVTTEGLLYPLRDEDLAFGPARGVSNRLVDTTVTIRLSKGRLWCFHERQSANTTSSASEVAL